MAKEITIDVFSASSINSAIRELDSFKDWLDGYADSIAKAVSHDMEGIAKQNVHIGSEIYYDSKGSKRKSQHQPGNLMRSIHVEGNGKGSYRLIADAGNKGGTSGPHYAQIEYERGTTEDEQYGGEQNHAAFMDEPLEWAPAFIESESMWRYIW